MTAHTVTPRCRWVDLTLDHWLVIWTDNVPMHTGANVIVGLSPCSTSTGRSSIAYVVGVLSTDQANMRSHVREANFQLL